MGVASSGAEALAGQQSGGGEGRAMEAAVLGALRVLNVAMEHDTEVVAYLQQSVHAGEQSLLNTAVTQVSSNVASSMIS